MISDIIRNTIFIGCGSFLGGAARYLISVAMKTMSKGFPWGTLAVNLVGCLVIGLLWGFFSKNSSESSLWALFMTVGICSFIFLVTGGILNCQYCWNMRKPIRIYYEEQALTRLLSFDILHCLPVAASHLVPFS